MHTIKNAIIFLVIALTAIGLRIPLAVGTELNVVYFTSALFIGVALCASLQSARLRVPTATEVFGGLFVAYFLVASIVYSPEPGISLGYAALLAAWVLMAYLVAARSLQDLEGGLVAGVRFVVIYVLISTAASLFLGGGRLSGLVGGNANSIAWVSVWVLAIYAYLNASGRIRNAEFDSALLVLTASVLFSGSRAGAGVLAVALGLLALYGVLGRGKLLRSALVALVGGVLGAGIFMLYDPVAFGVLVDKWTGTFGVFDSERGVSRLTHAQLAIDAISESPITVLFGRGLEAYGAYEDLVVAHLGQYNVLHSMHLQVLAGGGVVGVLLYSGYIFSAWWRSRQLTDRQAGALARVLIVSTLLYGAFHPQVVSRVLFFIVPIVIASCPGRRSDIAADNEPYGRTVSSFVS